MPLDVHVLEFYSRLSMASSLEDNYGDSEAVSENGDGGNGLYGGSSDDEEYERMTAAEVLQKLEEVSKCLKITFVVLGTKLLI